MSTTSPTPLLRRALLLVTLLALSLGGCNYAAILPAQGTITPPPTVTPTPFQPLPPTATYRPTPTFTPTPTITLSHARTHRHPPARHLWRRAGRAHPPHRQAH